MTEQLPRGIWYEPPRNRYRVRKYRNNKAYVAYRATLEAALELHAQLSAKISSIPRNKRGEKISRPIPTSSFAGLAKVAIRVKEKI